MGENQKLGNLSELDVRADAVDNKLKDNTNDDYNSIDVGSSHQSHGGRHGSHRGGMKHRRK